MSTQLAQRGRGPVPPALNEIVAGAKDRLMAVLPKHLTPERITQLLYVLAPRTKHLTECLPETIITSLVQVGSLGLDLSPGRNEAFLIPRWNRDLNAYECTFMPGCKGIEKLAVGTGVVHYIEPCEVREGDMFRVRRSTEGTQIEHEPSYQSGRGQITHLYTIAHMFDGKITVEVMTADEVEEIHLRSESYRNAQKYNKEETGPWATDWKEMALKTVLKRHCKRMPRRSDPASDLAYQRLQTAIDADNTEYASWQQVEPPAKPDNNSGYGHGMYASPQDTQTYLDALSAYLDKTNAQWLDKLGEVCRGDVPTTVKPLTKWQADNHLVKWAKDTGALDPVNMPEEAKNRQIGRFTAIVYHRSKADRKALANEMAAYTETHWRRQLEALSRAHPDLAPAIAERWGEPDDAADDADGDPEFDYEPGAAG